MWALIGGPVVSFHGVTGACKVNESHVSISETKENLVFITEVFFLTKFKSDDWFLDMKCNTAHKMIYPFNA